MKDDDKKEENEEDIKETINKTEEEKDGQNQEEKDGQNQEEKDGQNQEEKPEEKGKKSKQKTADKDKKQNLLPDAYALNEKIEKRAKDEPEFKKEYRHLSKRCKTFVTDLYKSCVNMEEIMALLDTDEKEFKEDMQGTVKGFFQKAIENNHIEVSEERT